MTKYDKGKPAERQGRKAAGLKLHERATMIAGLPTGSETVCRMAGCFVLLRIFLGGEGVFQLSGLLDKER